MYGLNILPRFDVADPPRLPRKGKTNMMQENAPTRAGNAFDGSWLRSQRLKMGLHQHQVAAKLDINQGRISEWENDQKPIPPDCLAQLQHLLN